MSAGISTGQERSVQRLSDWRPRGVQVDMASIAERLRAAFAGLPLPIIGAQTHYSLHRGSLSPHAWAGLLEAWPDLRLVLADYGDWSALPACLSAWGSERFALGAQLETPDGGLLLFLVPSEPAYARLSQLLSACHLQPDVLQQWQDEQIAPPDCSELIVVVDDLAWLRRLREAGAEVYWRSDLYPRQAPPGIAAVAAPICGFAAAADRFCEPVLHALRECRQVNGDLLQSAHIQSLEDIINLPSHYRGHEHELERSAELLARCQFHPDTAIHYPPCFYDDPPGELRRLSYFGLEERYGEEVPEAARERLEHELSVVAEKKFETYILTVYDLAQKRRTCGRGSAASSMICYCLGLTNVDPIRYQLVFERFLAPEREDPPDIDLDFPWDERDAVFAAATARYGRERVAMVCTHLHYRRWSAMRESARVHGIKRDDITAVKHHVSQVSRFGGEVSLSEPWDRILSAANQLCGAPRHYGMHPGGLVISEGPIANLVPTHPTGKIIDGQPLSAIAWEKDGAEAMGLLKIDLLGNRSLAVVRDCINDLREDGITIDERRWKPQDDPSTRRIIASGATMGCFYIESPAMRQLNAKAGSGDFDRLVIHSSIVRPAANKWINDYLERLHEYYRTGKMREEWFPHPALCGLLSESFGILSYQEDVMLAAKQLAGFTSREQNYLRKSLGRSDTRERLQHVAERFHSGCKERGVAASVAELVWSMISSFAGYSFCKAHSASYAMVSFQCAYLKAHHPAHFMARVIANEGGFYSRSAYVEEARRLGIAIRGPCVMRSQWLTRRETGCDLRLGLQCVPYLSRPHARVIVEEARRQPFRSFTDFYVRCQISQRECESLERAGAFNRLLSGFHQTERRWIIQAVCKAYVQPRKKSHSRKQAKPQVLRCNDACYAYMREHGFVDPEVPALPRPDNLAVLRDRYMHLGCLPYEHPLHLWALPRRQMRCRDITAAMHGQRVEIIAWCITRKQVEAVQRRGRDGVELAEPERSLMSFVTLEDESAVVETIWFPRTYKRYGSLLADTWPLRVSGTVQVEYQFPSLIVDRVERVGA